MSETDIVIMYGDQPFEMVESLLNRLNIIDELPRDGVIGIKPNLVLARPSESGATTDPEIVSGIIEYLHTNGFYNIEILESAWLGDDTEEAFRVCGYREISSKFDVPLVDLKRDSSVRVRSGGEVINVCKRATQIGYLINVPVLKAHCQTRLTCALKNLKGCIPDSEKRRFHDMGLHRPIARLSTIIKTDLVVVDGIVGDLTFEEGGTPVKMNRIIAGKDPVLMDAYAATLIGYSPDDIGYIPLAEEMGVGTTDLKRAKIFEINQGEDTGFHIPSTRKVEMLSGFVNEDRACSACFGSLIHALQRLSERGALSDLKEKVSIGQGFKKTTGKGTGIGTCTKGLNTSLKGCPPNAQEIVSFLLDSAI